MFLTTMFFRIWPADQNLSSTNYSVSFSSSLTLPRKVHTHTHTRTHTHTHTHTLQQHHSRALLCVCLGSYAPSGELLAWRDRNHKWLELMEVHTQETSRIRVTVMPFYMGRKELHSGSMGTILVILYTCVNMCVRSYTTAVLSHTDC